MFSAEKLIFITEITVHYALVCRQDLLTSSLVAPELTTVFQVADILAATGGSRPRKRSSHIEFNRPAVPLAQMTTASHAHFNLSGFNDSRVANQSLPSAFGSIDGQVSRRPPAAESPPIQRERFTLFPLYETKQHPFGNYWTFQGGLVELVGVLPSKQQADVLVGIYFECVDPLYPIVNRIEFLAEYVSVSIPKIMR